MDSKIGTPGYLGITVTAAFSPNTVINDARQRWLFRMVHSPAPLAHPLDDRPAILLERSVETTAANLGPDVDWYRHLFGYFCAHWNGLDVDLLAPPRLPRHPIAMARFGLKGKTWK